PWRFPAGFGRRCTVALLATSRSPTAVVAQHPFPNGTGILGRLSLLDRESGSLAESPQDRHLSTAAISGDRG
ncbi:MAG: hypothetical protein ACXVH3_37870, partial [Solirubrobacteraceae bacterium]